MLDSTAPIRVVVSTLDSEAAARKLGRELVELGVAACVSIVPIAASIYRWAGRIEETPEFLLWMKTSTERLDELIATLRALHPYDLPEIVVLDACASESYAAWVAASTARSSR